MHIKKMLHIGHQKINNKRAKYLIGIGVVLLLIALYAVSFRERTIEYSYSGENCQDQVIILPRLFHASGSSDYTIMTKGGWVISGYPLVSTSVCIEANNTPKSQGAPVAISIVGNWLARIAYKVQVPEAPKASLGVFDAPISAAQPLIVTLDKPDQIFNYSIHTDTATAECNATDSQLACDIPSLQLQQGAEYSLAVKRAFKDQTSETLANVSVKTLSPVVITASSVTEAATLYDEPTRITMDVDKVLESARFELVRGEGDAKESIPIESAVTDQKVTVTFSQPLARSSQFVLTSTSLTAADGSTLAQPYTLRFKTSGGPAVTGTNIGASNVPQSAQIVVNFDQPIKDTVDIAKFARVSGATATVRKQSATQIILTLQNAPLCAAFSVVVDKGIQSGTNSAVSQAGWSFDSRTVCGTSSVIGYSVRGKPITAYYFGNGATTILFTGGMHGSEPSGTTTMKAFVDYLMTNAYKIPSDKRIVIVPDTNPDAIAAGTRNNANNVNIDRNFPATSWVSSIETASGTLPQGGGASAGSEPETQALIALTRLLKPRLEVSFHAQGRLVGANKIGDSVVIGDIYANTVGYNTMYSNVEEVMGGYTITGEYEDWMGEELAIPAILIELPTPSGNYLQSQLNALWKMISI
jgi:protein MpaA